MKKIFLDCGTHLGWGFNHFKRMYDFDPSWEIHLFEPNPYLGEVIHERVLLENPGLDITFHSVAVGSSNMPKVAEFNLQGLPEDPTGIHPGGLTGGGSTLAEAPYLKEGQLEGYEKIKVEIVPLRKILEVLVEKAMKENPEIVNFDEETGTMCLYRNRCQIVVKLDVEGAEYDILREMVETNYGSWIKDLHIEFHKRRFKNEEEFRNLEVFYVGELFQQGVACFPHW